MDEGEYKDIPQIILICPIDYGEKLPLFACKNKLFKLISELNIEIFWKLILKKKEGKWKAN